VAQEHPAQRRLRWLDGLVGTAIICVLAVVVVPAFRGYVRRARTAEAVDNLSSIYRAAVTYYEAEQPDGNHRFPQSQATTPALGACCGQPGDKCNPALSADAWKSPTWTALGFSIVDPFRYSYRFDSDGVNRSANFTAAAFGDLDCDGVYSTFMRLGASDCASTQACSAWFIERELE
jgi:type II secretory pathway pseudopilin PulG